MGYKIERDHRRQPARRYRWVRPLRSRHHVSGDAVRSGSCLSLPAGTRNVRQPHTHAHTIRITDDRAVLARQTPTVQPRVERGVGSK